MHIKMDLHLGVPPPLFLMGGQGRLEDQDYFKGLGHNLTHKHKMLSTGCLTNKTLL